MVQYVRSTPPSAAAFVAAAFVAAVTVDCELTTTTHPHGLFPHVHVKREGERERRILAERERCSY